MNKQEKIENLQWLVNNGPSLITESESEMKKDNRKYITRKAMIPFYAIASLATIASAMVNGAYDSPYGWVVLSAVGFGISTVAGLSNLWSYYENQEIVRKSEKKIKKYRHNLTEWKKTLESLTQK